MQDGKNILILGATGGIGRAVVDKLSAEQHSLILVSNNSESLQKLLSEIKNSACSAVVYTVDLEDELSYLHFCTDLKVGNIQIDWIIHCAGYINNEVSFSKEVNVADLRKTFEINFIAPFQITQFLFSKISGGGVIFITSTAALAGNGFFPSYASSKSALTTFAQSLALHWKETKNRSIIICPGPTKTAMREKIAGDSDLHQSPTVVASYVLEAFKDPAKYPNGSNLIVMGGNGIFFDPCKYTL